MSNTIKILIADDFPLLREDLCDIINSQPDMEVVGTAACGEEIKTLALKIPFHLILMDIEMEQMNSGILATEYIRERLPDAKVIFLTAHETEEMIVTAMGAGAVDYLVKGGDSEELLHHIRSAAQGKPLMKSSIQQLVMKEYARLQKSEQSLLFFINNIAKLTLTERELIKLLLQGCKASDIAAIRCVEPSTVKTQIKGLLRKFGCARSKEIVELIHSLHIEHLF